MTPDESSEILALLAKAYPRFDMPDESVTLYQGLLTSLDYRVAYRAALEWVKDEKWYPTVADLREYARKTRRDIEAEDWALAALAADRKPASPTDIPEWVQVWAWWRDHTVQARIDANTAMKQCPPEHRPPVKLREFPQLPDLAPDAYSWDEYHAIRDQWVEAGCPNVGAAEILDVAGVSE